MAEGTRTKASLIRRVGFFVALLVVLQGGLFFFFGWPTGFSPIRAGILAFGLLGIARAFVLHFERPRGWSALAGTLLASLGWGALGAGLLSQVFEALPGGAATPWAAFAAAGGFGLLRGHGPLLKEAVKERDATPGRLPRKAYWALALLTAGYAVLGFAGFFLFRVLSPFIPFAGKALTVLALGYVLYGVKLLLAFAALEARAAAEGFWPWFKANFAQNAIVLALLLAYLVFRADFREFVPYFPLVEFGLAVALFGLVLARLRARLSQGVAELPVASTRRPHAQRADLVSEPEYDHLATAVRAFVERGRGTRVYEEAVRRSARIESEEVAARALAPVREHPATVASPALPLGWALAAGLAAPLGFALFLYTFLEGLPQPPRGVTGASFSPALALGALSIGVYRLAGGTHAYARPLLSFAIGGAGALLFFLAFLLFALTEGPLAIVPWPAWAVGGGIAAALALAAARGAWRLHRRARDDPLQFVPDEGAAALNARAREAARRAVFTVSFIAAVAFLVVPALIDWAVTAFGLMEAVPRAYQAVLGPAMLFLGGLGAGAGLRLAGLARERPRALDRESRERALRLQVHQRVMERIDRV